MTSTTTATRSIIIERQMAHPPERIWRALTTSHLIAEWLMKNDFEPVEGHRFTFRATPLPGWSGVTNCVVLKVEPQRLLSYSWGDGTESDSGLKTVVTWTLTANAHGTLVAHGAVRLPAAGRRWISRHGRRLAGHPRQA